MTVTTTTIQGCGRDLTIGVAFGASSFKLVVLGFVLSDYYGYSWITCAIIARFPFCGAFKLIPSRIFEI